MTTIAARVLCTLLLSTALATSASAQTPTAGQNAFGFDVGLFIPDEQFENALTIAAFGEHSFTPRLSGRVMFGWTNPGVDNQTEDHFRQVKLLFNAVYNWEGGRIHPFVTGGAGAYFVRLKREDRPDPDGETRGGINFGGGVEYFTNSLTTIKGEARFDIVSHPTGLPDATGFTLTIGLKRYF